MSIWHFFFFSAFGFFFLLVYSNYLPPYCTNTFYNPIWRRLISQSCQYRLALLIKEDWGIGFKGVCQSGRNLACFESVDDADGDGFGKYKVNIHQER